MFCPNMSQGMHRSPVSDRLLGGVLAGGRSSRMGSDKSALRLPGGQTLLERSLGLLRGYCQCFRISVARPDQIVPEYSDYTVVDADSGQGPASGVAALLTVASERKLDALLVLSVDLPLIETQDLLPLVECWQKTPDQIATATADGKRPEPLIAIYPTAMSEEIHALSIGDDRSLSRWIGRAKHELVTVRPAALESVNTPEQWHRLFPVSEP